MIIVWDNYIYGSPQPIGLGGFLTWSSEPIIVVYKALDIVVRSYDLTREIAYPDTAIPTFMPDLTRKIYTEID